MINYTIKNILVPFDFTHGALNALKVADKFAVDFGSRVHLVNIMEPYVQHGPVRTYPSHLNNLNEYEIRSCSAVRRYLEQNSLNPMAYTYNVEMGFCASTLINLGSKGDYDLIIVPDDSKNYLSQMVSRYNPLKIMERTSTPVISVNRYYRIVDFHNVILPIRNLPNWYDKIPFMISLVKQTGGNIHALGLEEKGGSYSGEFNRIFDLAVSLLEQEGVLRKVVKFKGNNILGELNRFSEMQKGDLIAITPQKSGVIRSIFNPPLYSRFVGRSPAPLFGVRTLI